MRSCLRWFEWKPLSKFQIKSDPPSNLFLFCCRPKIINYLAVSVLFALHIDCILALLSRLFTLPLVIKCKSLCHTSYMFLLCKHTANTCEKHRIFNVVPFIKHKTFDINREQVQQHRRVCVCVWCDNSKYKIWWSAYLTKRIRTTDYIQRECLTTTKIIETPPPTPCPRSKSWY